MLIKVKRFLMIVACFAVNLNLCITCSLIVQLHHRFG
jgi:hypothetical protein